MTLINATSLNDQVDYAGTNGRSYAEQMLNSIFNVSPRNAVTEDDDDDDIDETIPDTDDDLYDDDDEDAFPDTDDDLDDVDEDEDDDDTGSTTAGLNNPPVSGRGAQGRTSGRMIDHEPGSINNNNLD